MNLIPDFASGNVKTPKSVCRWEDEEVWGGQKPGRGDTVVIPEGVTIVYSGHNEEPIKNLIVQGKLVFDRDSDSLLKLHTAVVEGDGEIEAGTPEEYVRGSAEVVFIDEPLDPENDPLQFGCGLLLKDRAKFTAHGRPRDPAVRLAKDILAGVTAFTVDELPVGWFSGDRLAFPPSGGTTLKWDQREPEIREMSYTIGDSVVGVNFALSEPHLAARDADGEPDCFPDVLNLTRNVVFRSENPEGVRGHFMATDFSSFDISYCAFQDMGRTTDAPLGPDNLIGRYAVHFHMLEGPPPPGSALRGRFTGNVIERALKWGLAIHASSCLVVEANIAYDCQTAGFVTEDGHEAYNSIVGNYAVLVRRGDGFWLNGNRNWIDENTAACCYPHPHPAAVQGIGFNGTGTGFYFPPTPYVWEVVRTYRPDGEQESFYRGKVSCLSLRGNRAYGCSTGLWFDHTRAEHYVDGFTVWFGYGFADGGRSEDGRAVVAYDTDGCTFDELVSRQCSFEHQANVRTVLIHSDIQGCYVGIRDNALNGRLNVTLCHLRNTANAWIYLSPSAGAGPIPKGPIKETVFLGTTFRKMPGQPTPRHIELGAVLNGTTSRVPVLANTVDVINYNGDPMDSFKVLFEEQKADVIVPWEEDIPEVEGNVRKACPEKGLTNAQAWARHKCAWAGSVAPDNYTTREGILGLVVQGV